MFYKADGLHYLEFLKEIHKKEYDQYIEIGSRSGRSLRLSCSPSIAIDPFFQLSIDPIKDKNYVLFFQCKFDDFFHSVLKSFPSIKCELAFIDGMHLFEYALMDFINLAKLAKSNSLFLFHDIMPWTFEMTTRQFENVPKGAPWTGDIWKLLPILIETGFKNYLKVIPAEPSGILAVYSPPRELLYQLEEKYLEIKEKWVTIDLKEYELDRFYEQAPFQDPESYLELLNIRGFGSTQNNKPFKWVSH